MSTREHVTTTWGALRKGDRFADGWRVEAVKVNEAEATVFVSAGRNQRGRIAKPRTEAVTVSRAASTAGRYVRQSRVNRETGTTIEVLDLAAPGSEFEPERERITDTNGNVTGHKIVNRFATVCVDHSWIITHPTLRHATSHAANPFGWCEPCREVGEGCTCTRSGSEITEESPSCPLHG